MIISEDCQETNYANICSFLLLQICSLTANLLLASELPLMILMLLILNQSLVGRDLEHKEDIDLEYIVLWLVLCLNQASTTKLEEALLCKDKGRIPT